MDTIFKEVLPGWTRHAANLYEYGFQEVEAIWDQTGSLTSSIAGVLPIPGSTTVLL